MTAIPYERTNRNTFECLVELYWSRPSCPAGHIWRTGVFIFNRQRLQQRILLFLVLLETARLFQRHRRCSVSAATERTKLSGQQVLKKIVTWSDRFEFYELRKKNTRKYDDRSTGSLTIITRKKRTSNVNDRVRWISVGLSVCIYFENCTRARARVWQR